MAAGTPDWAVQRNYAEFYFEIDADIDKTFVGLRGITIDLGDRAGVGEGVVRFPNDAYQAGVGDRNLIVDRIEIGGHVLEGEGDRADNKNKGEEWGAGADGERGREPARRGGGDTLGRRPGR